MSAIAPASPATFVPVACAYCGDIMTQPTDITFALSAIRGISKLILEMMFNATRFAYCSGCCDRETKPIIARLAGQKAVAPIIAEKASDNDSVKPVSTVPAQVVQQEIAPEPVVTPAVTEPATSSATPAETPKADEKAVIETKKYAAPKPAEAQKPAAQKVEKTEAPKPEPEAQKPEAKAEKKHVFSGLAKVAMSIIDNDGTVTGDHPKAEKLRVLPNGIKQTRCIVALSAPTECVCGGWHQWDVMPAIVRRMGRSDRRDPSFPFGPECATKATAEFLSQKGYVDPFKSGITLDVAILGERSIPQVPFTAPAEETTATGTPVAKPIAAADVGYEQLAQVFGIKQPVMGEFKSVQDAFGRTAMLADLSRALNGEFVKNPSLETLTKMIEGLEKLVFNGAVQTVTWGRITPEAARRLSGNALLFSQEARSIASRMTVQPPAPKAKPIKVPAPVTAPQAPAEESADVATKPVAPKMTTAARKAARSAADAATRAGMKSKKGESGKQGKGKK